MTVNDLHPGDLLVNRRDRFLNRRDRFLNRRDRFWLVLTVDAAAQRIRLLGQANLQVREWVNARWLVDFDVYRRGVLIRCDPTDCDDTDALTWLGAT